MTAAGKTTFFTTVAGLIGSTLLLALPLVVAQVGDTADSNRIIDVTLSRFAFSPERIEVRLGERVWLNVVSADGAHGFQVKELGLNARTPARGKSTAIALTPTKVGTFEITCSEYCGSGHSRMKAWLIVTPGT
jgi:cytochrome c oxidase subunit 2